MGDRLGRRGSEISEAAGKSATRHYRSTLLLAGHSSEAELIEVAATKLLYPPHHNLALKPIEMAFSKLKVTLQKPSPPKPVFGNPSQSQPRLHPDRLWQDQSEPREKERNTKPVTHVFRLMRYLSRRLITAPNNVVKVDFPLLIVLFGRDASHHVGKSSVKRLLVRSRKYRAPQHRPNPQANRRSVSAR